MIGVEEAFGEQRVHVAAAQPVEDASTVSAGVYETGQAQLRQVLAGYALATARGCGQRGYILFPVAHRPQHPDPGRFAQQRERERGLVDLFGTELIGMASRGARAERSGHALTLAAYCDTFATAHVT